MHLGRLMGPAGFSRTVAIKRLHPQFAQDAHFLAMFLDEARVTGRIVHPNIVSTIDVVQERGELFIVMDFVRGAALSTLFQTSLALERPIDVDLATGIIMDTLAGLHAAHEATGEGQRPLEVIHRDVSPHNVLVGTDGLARIADFGIAKAVGRIQSTAEGQLKGKLTYMAPEVIRGEDIDRRVDVYAAAVVYWELLTGRKLFSGNEASVLYDVLDGTVDPPSLHRPELPIGLDDVILKGLAKDPAARWESAAAMSEAIERVVAAAPARRIGAWVAELAASDLEVRAGLIDDLERTADAPPLGSTSTPADSGARIDAAATRVERASDESPRPSQPRTAEESTLTEEQEEPSPPAVRSPGRRSRVGIALVSLGIGGAVATAVYLPGRVGSSNARTSTTNVSEASTASTVQTTATASGRSSPSGASATPASLASSESDTAATVAVFAGTYASSRGSVGSGSLGKGAVDSGAVVLTQRASDPSRVSGRYSRGTLDCVAQMHDLDCNWMEPTATGRVVFAKEASGNLAGRWGNGPNLTGGVWNLQLVATGSAQPSVTSTERAPSMTRPAPSSSARPTATPLPHVEAPVL